MTATQLATPGGRVAVPFTRGARVVLYPGTVLPSRFVRFALVRLDRMPDTPVEVLVTNLQPVEVAS